MSFRVQITQLFKNRKEWLMKTALWSGTLLGYFSWNISPLFSLFIDMDFQSCKQRYPKKGKFLYFYKTECNFYIKITFYMPAEKNNLVNVKCCQSLWGLVYHFKFKLSQIWNAQLPEKVSPVSCTQQGLQRLAAPVSPPPLLTFHVDFFPLFKPEISVSQLWD